MKNACITLVLIGLVSGCGDQVATSTNNIEGYAKLSSNFPVPGANVSASVTGGACGIDESEAQDGIRTISGWGFISEKEATLPDVYVIEVLSGSDKKYGILDKADRPDTASYFKNDKLLHSGFNSTYQVKDLPKESKIFIYQVLGELVIKCSQEKIL